jgi:hypothetical protein
MSVTSYSHRAALLAAAIFVAPLAAHAAVEGPTLAMIPAVQKPLSILRVQSTPVGQSFVRETITRAAPQASESSLNGVTKFRTTDRLAAYASEDGADFEILPNLEQLPTGHFAGTAAQARARAVFARPDVIPQDDTTVALGSPNVLHGGNSSTGKSAALLTYVAAKRLVDGLPVLGTGSRAAIGIANDGSVQAFVKHWHTAQRAETVTPTRTPSQVQSEIVRQLSRLETPTAHVVVDRVGLAYYDGNGQTLQPVYYFTARIRPQGAAASAIRDGDAVVGYLPVGDAVEAIPSLDAPSATPVPSQAQLGGIAPDGIGSGSTVGVYVVNDAANQSAWDNDGYFAAQDLAGAGAAFTQYYYASQALFLSAANSYVNAVNFNVTEVHGDWWVFSTLNNNANFVYLSQIGSGGNPGYGGYGRMAHWLLHACEVIPSMFDESLATGNSQNAFNVWWNIFKGLHQAIGYRTIMFIADGAGPAYAADLEYGGNVTTSWFNSLSSLSDYQQGWTYLSGHFNRQVPYGMPSVMTIPGLQNETAFANWPASPATSTGLYNYWEQGATD